MLIVLYLYEIYRIMENNKKLKPTESELEILQVLWEKGSATVREVHEILEPVKDVGYTTTLKTMQVMAEKGMLGRNTSQRTHVYTPLLTRENTQSQFLNKMIDGLFSGSASRMVIGALSQEKISDKDLKEIREYLNNIENQGS